MNVHIPIADIPQTVLDDAGIRLQDYLVPIFGVVDHERAPHVRLLGSGTLVKINAGHHILTAGHVWHLTRQFDRIGLALTSYPSAFAIPREFISPQELWNREGSEWGPDLAILRLPLASVPQISAHKSFLDFVQQKAKLVDYPPDLEFGLWAVTGMVGEFSHVERRPEDKSFEAYVHGRAFFSGIHRTCDRNGYDYLEASAKLDLPAVPKSFGGVSGGGLWQVVLSKAASGEISWDGRRHFRGVAFWQSSPCDGRRVIRCHGPKSLFEKAWGAWELGQ